MRIWIPLAALVAALAIPAGAMAMEATIGNSVAPTAGTGPTNYLIDGKYLPQTPPAAVSAYTSAGSRLRAGEGSGGAINLQPYTSLGSRLRAGEGSGGATNTVSPTAATVSTSDHSGFGSPAIWSGVGVALLALLGGAVAVLRRRLDHQVPAQA